jgi:hydroxymethylpyrimidine pyrophosphatase-like HAD family hydrolase
MTTTYDIDAGRAPRRREPRDLTRADVVLATDLDGTFLGGSPDQRRPLYEWIGRNRARVGLIFVTGRSLAMVAPLLDDPEIPSPDLVIADVGASLAGGDLAPLTALETRVLAGWPGAERVAGLFEDLLGSGHLCVQDVPQRGRLSFYTNRPEVVPIVRARAAAHGLEVIYSCDRFLDVLPGGVDKGRSLEILLRHLGVTAGKVLCCGDTLNDEALFRPGWRGVVVGGAEPALLEATRGRPEILHSRRPGAAGIAEALSRFFGESL